MLKWNIENTGDEKRSAASAVTEGLRFALASLKLDIGWRTTLTVYAKAGGRRLDSFTVPMDEAMAKANEIAGREAEYLREKGVTQ